MSARPPQTPLPSPRAAPAPPPAAPGERATDPGRKTYRHGTHRTQTPAQTIERVRPLMPALGITRIANVTGLDVVGVPVVMICRPNARSIAVAQGKGIDLEAAKASGLMEAVEAWHAEHITLALRYASQRELGEAVLVEGLPRPPGSPFHTDLPLLWVAGREWMSGAELWTPYETVHANYTLPAAPGSGCFLASTNGLAAGNHPLEAIAHGALEVIERDATTLWHRLPAAGRARSRLVAESVDDPLCRSVLDRLAQADIDSAIWETTTDVGIASFFCLLAERGDARPTSARPAAGAGCHTDRSVALLRALTEAVQVRATYIAGARDDLDAREYAASSHAVRLRSARRAIASHRPVRRFGDVPNHVAPTFAAELEWIGGRLRAVGIERMVVVELTRPEFGLPVVRVLIPGLEGPDDHGAGYVPGRRARAARWLQ